MRFSQPIMATTLTAMFDITNDEAITLNVAPVAQQTKDDLSHYPPLHAENYEGFKTDFLKWLLRTGKSPDKGNGYAQQTVRQTHYRIEHVYRWKWEEQGEVTTEFTPDDADKLIDLLKKRTTKSEGEIAKFQKAIKRLFKYFNHTKGRDYDWEPPYLNDKGNESLSHNYFKKYELSRLYQAAIEISSFKSYNNKNMSSEERQRLKIHLAQRFGKPKNEIGPKDFKQANSWKIPSLVSVCCDCGLRPIEVERSRTDWINFRDNELVIPYDQSSKGDSTWEVSLSSESVRALQKWMDERNSLDKYQNSNSIWLTKYGNPYNSGSLNDVLDKLIEEGNIEPRNRNLTWYSIRRGVATLWANEEGIHNAKEQVRHKQIETTERYISSGSEQRAEMADSKW